MSWKVLERLKLKVLKLIFIIFILKNFDFDVALKNKYSKRYDFFTGKMHFFKFGCGIPHSPHARRRYTSIHIQEVRGTRNRINNIDNLQVIKVLLRSSYLSCVIEDGNQMATHILSAMLAV